LLAQKRRLRFCRIANASAPAHAEEFRSWLHEAVGEMQWMERGAEKRCDRKKFYPARARSSSSRLTTGREEGAANARAASRYAWGDDYHEMMLEKLSS
jgi:epoxyqueuosine reductase